jgi:hypothetical protein
MKNLTALTHEKPLSVREHRKRCEDFFRMCGLDLRCVPSNMIESFSKAEVL